MFSSVELKCIEMFILWPNALEIMEVTFQLEHFARLTF